MMDNYLGRAADNAAEGQRLVAWTQMLKQHWNNLRFGEIHIESANGQHYFEIQVYADDINIEGLAVELYAEGVNGDFPICQPMQRSRELVGAVNGYIYTASVSSSRPATDYTARIVPYDAAASVPLESNCILWQR
ncbi:hypothetical protein [Methylomarinum vadi]|uniref:hypothetical protein n=1 Tax=Methylomarinum vadi TaxID=438855 RepID=UPI0004DF14C2|nr:hypothetical protein [Methylomarinum vadi]